MMDQFEVLKAGHTRWLAVGNEDHYAKYLGFLVLIKRLPDVKDN